MITFLQNVTIVSLDSDGNFRRIEDGKVTGLPVPSELADNADIEKPTGDDFRFFLVFNADRSDRTVSYVELPDPKDFHPLRRCDELDKEKESASYSALKRLRVRSGKGDLPNLDTFAENLSVYIGEYSVSLCIDTNGMKIITPEKAMSNLGLPPRGKIKADEAFLIDNPEHLEIFPDEFEGACYDLAKKVASTHPCDLEEGLKALKELRDADPEVYEYVED